MIEKNKSLSRSGRDIAPLKTPEEKMKKKWEIRNRRARSNFLKRCGERVSRMGVGGEVGGQVNFRITF